MRKRDQKIDYSILFIIISSLVFTDPGATTMLLDAENAKSYLSPLGTMLGTGMNSGYFHRGSVHKKTGFDLKLDFAYIMFPPQSTTYDFIVPETPIDVLFPLKFPKNKLKYKHPALLDYIPETETDGIFYEDNVSVTMPLNTLIFTEEVSTVIGDSSPDTLEFNFDRANEGDALYNKMLERVWSEIENIEGIGKHYFLYDEEGELITILSPAYNDSESFSSDFAQNADLDLSGTLESTLDTMNLDLILPGGFDYLFNQLPISNGMPLPIIQASVGLPFHSEIAVRASPEIPISSIGSIQYGSIGGKTSIADHLIDIFDFSPRYKNYLDINSYTNIFSPNIKPKDVDKALRDFRRYDLDIREIDSLNVLFKQGNIHIVRDMQHKIQDGLLAIDEMHKATSDDEKFPFELSLGYYFNYYKLNMGGPELSAMNRMVSIQLGKTYKPRFIPWFGGIGIYGGFGIESSNIDLSYTYTNTLNESNDNTISFIGDNKFRGLIGTRMRILLIDAFIDYNMGASNTINAGFGIIF